MTDRGLEAAPPVALRKPFTRTHHGDQVVDDYEWLRDADNPDAQLLREAVEMTGCMRRLLAGRTIDEIHRAFGAPGDFGYETPIGAALAAAYRGGSQ